MFTWLEGELSEEKPCTTRDGSDTLIYLETKITYPHSLSGFPPGLLGGSGDIPTHIHIQTSLHTHTHTHTHLTSPFPYTSHPMSHPLPPPSPTHTHKRVLQLCSPGWPATSADSLLPAQSSAPSWSEGTTHATSRPADAAGTAHEQGLEGVCMGVSVGGEGRGYVQLYHSTYKPFPTGLAVAKFGKNLSIELVLFYWSLK